MKEIVAILIGDTKTGTITTDRTHITTALELKLDVHWIERRQLQFMAACDLGPQWTALAQAPTLFRVDEQGAIHPPLTGDPVRPATPKAESAKKPRNRRKKPLRSLQR